MFRYRAAEVPRDDLPGAPLDGDDTSVLTEEDRAAGANASSQNDEDTCFWQKVLGPTCVGGQLRERWCYICCSGGVCETVSCEWRVVGAC